MHFLRPYARACLPRISSLLPEDERQDCAEVSWHRYRAGSAEQSRRQDAHNKQPAYEDIVQMFTVAQGLKEQLERESAARENCAPGRRANPFR